MGEPNVVNGEVADSKVAAVFDTVAQARQAAERLREATGLQPAQVQVVTPADAHPGRRIEPESTGIARTMVRAHITLGIAGAIAGLALAGVLWALGVRFVLASPLAAFGVCLFFGATLGMMFGGLVTLRPDHDAYVLDTREALDAGKAVVVVHGYTREEREAAEAILSREGGRTTSTL